MLKLIIFGWHAESQTGQHIFQASCVHVGKMDLLKVMYRESSLLTVSKCKGRYNTFFQNVLFWVFAPIIIPFLFQESQPHYSYRPFSPGDCLKFEETDGCCQWCYLFSKLVRVYHLTLNLIYHIKDHSQVYGSLPSLCYKPMILCCHFLNILYVHILTSLLAECSPAFPSSHHSFNLHSPSVSFPELPLPCLSAWYNCLISTLTSPFPRAALSLPVWGGGRSRALCTEALGLTCSNLLPPDGPRTLQ